MSEKFWKHISMILLVGFFGMTAINQMLTWQRNEARQVHADFEGKSMVCWLEEKH